MDDLQYWKVNAGSGIAEGCCFKPYYKWMTFNTQEMLMLYLLHFLSFKPYYKWMTFNTGQ